MKSGGKVEEKLLRKERKYEVEQRMKEKRSEDREVFEEVFDQTTLLTIYDLLNRGVIDRLHGVVKAGKESRVYRGVDPKGRDLAVKIYLTTSAEFRRGMMPYIQDDPRFLQARQETKSLIYAWALREFRNLQKAYRAGVPVPKPIAVSKNVLVMEFIGKDGVPAPLLKDEPPKKPNQTYNHILKYVKQLYQKADLVHGDLSEYNIMMWKNQPVIFDISQAVPSQHPMART
ncbi:MAG: serine protein kinase RIO, partial [Candidatus Bathyarchaeia archaeon]